MTRARSLASLLGVIAAVVPLLDAGAYEPRARRGARPASTASGTSVPSRCSSARRSSPARSSLLPRRRARSRSASSASSMSISASASRHRRRRRLQLVLVGLGQRRERGPPHLARRRSIGWQVAGDHARSQGAHEGTGTTRHGTGAGPRLPHRERIGVPSRGSRVPRSIGALPGRLQCRAASRSDAYNNNLRIVQTRDYVVLLTEMIHDARVVPLDGRPHLPAGIQRWSGDSRGHWEGDTLVVDTTGFTDKTPAFQLPLSIETALDGGTVGSGVDLHLIERFTPVGEGRLLYQYTVEDPAALTRPFTVAIPMRASRERMFEYACHEGNYAMRGMLKGARTLEVEEEAAARRVSERSAH